MIDLTRNDTYHKLFRAILTDGKKVFINPLGPRIFIKTCHHIPRISGKFLAILPLCVQKSVEKNYSILTITSCVYFEE